MQLTLIILSIGLAQSYSPVCETLSFSRTCSSYPNKLVVLTTVDYGMLSFFEMWHKSAARYIDHSCMQLVAMAEDDATFSSLRHDFSEAELDVQTDRGIKAEMFPAFASRIDELKLHAKSHYNAIVSRRPFYISKLLHQGCSVLYVDIDTLWKADPFLELLKMDQGRGQLYVTIDNPNPHKDEFCTCFLYIQPTNWTNQVIDGWAKALFGESPNQPAFNTILKRMDPQREKRSVLPFARFPPGCVANEFVDSAAVLHANWRVGHFSKESFLRKYYAELDLGSPPSIRLKPTQKFLPVRRYRQNLQSNLPSNLRRFISPYKFHHRFVNGRISVRSGVD